MQPPPGSWTLQREFPCQVSRCCTRTAMLLSMHADLKQPHLPPDLELQWADAYKHPDVAGRHNVYCTDAEFFAMQRMAWSLRVLVCGRQKVAA